MGIGIVIKPCKNIHTMSTFMWYVVWISLSPLDPKVSTIIPNSRIPFINQSEIIGKSKDCRRLSETKGKFFMKLKKINKYETNNYYNKSIIINSSKGKENKSASRRIISHVYQQDKFNSNRINSIPTGNTRWARGVLRCGMNKKKNAHHTCAAYEDTYAMMGLSIIPSRASNRIPNRLLF